MSKAKYIASKINSYKGNKTKIKFEVDDSVTESIYHTIRDTTVVEGWKDTLNITVERSGNWNYDIVLMENVIKSVSVYVGTWVVVYRRRGS